MNKRIKKKKQDRVLDTIGARHLKLNKDELVLIELEKDMTIEEAEFVTNSLVPTLKDRLGKNVVFSFDGVIKDVTVVEKCEIENVPKDCEDCGACEEDGEYDYDDLKFYNGAIVTKENASETFAGILKEEGLEMSFLDLDNGGFIVRFGTDSDVCFIINPQGKVIERYDDVHIDSSKLDEDYIEYINVPENMYLALADHEGFGWSDDEVRLALISKYDGSEIILSSWIEDDDEAEEAQQKFEEAIKKFNESKNA